MDAMMETLEPEIVLVYSQVPDAIEEKYPDTKFVEYPDWTSAVRKEKEENREQRHATVYFDKSDINMLACLLQR